MKENDKKVIRLVVCLSPSLVLKKKEKVWKILTILTILIRETLTPSKPLRWHFQIPSLIYSWDRKFWETFKRTFFRSFVQVHSQREIQMRQKEEFTFNLNLTCAYLTERNSQMTTWRKSEHILASDLARKKTLSFFER